MKIKLVAIVAVVGFVLTFGVAFILASVQRADAADMCMADTGSLPAEVNGYKRDQLTNAAAIVRAGMDLGIDQHGQILAVMTAMGESSLRNVTYGDWETSGVTNPDGSRTTSIGLFQQQDSWGTVQERMDPSRSAALFYGRLTSVDGWQTMPATLAIHAVQVNDNPQHYAPFEADAKAIVTALTTACSAGTGEWVVPARGKMTDRFGSCEINRPGDSCHKGTDLATGSCGSPIWAAGSGTVTFAGVQPYRGNVVWIDHGNGIESGYFHMEDGSLRVAKGDQIAAGTQIGTMGETGFSFGCHLHFEIHHSGKPINPEPFMQNAGAPLPG
ncbi:M23 family metallopeptidase [Microbacterium sp. NPDC006705]|uniref:M23 family metallopeptidase n=1 Tax=Microbacterium TaxID=33882 RepID=UPI0022B00B30|nr:MULTISPECIES: M23 family metallopeptidase [Microbacterium]MCZ4069088.1 M23 family metallopeptidase [Microbacterium sp. H37-C3]WHE37876.1 M23 family metallopeptidase [Microbacterium sp. BDGP8]WRK17157.1 M23 family metallopeptidase [Microbacterium plantarum]